ncbi:putative protein phosphatase 2C 63 [Hibiscus syriacus]|uniref:PPM-type phosphatase domain-containing protein n=1 Tax=Hibiscus syriacus TaxID=106335 RepID=A0A6A2X0N9_HIBSY|nr:putative protein phosphatase 2C 63 [Hibiscus syriacus]
MVLCGILTFNHTPPVITPSPWFKRKSLEDQSQVFTSPFEFATEQGGLSADVIKKAFNATEEEFLHLVKRSLPVRPQIASSSLGMRGSEDKKNKVVSERLSTDHNVGVEEVRKEVEALHPDDSHIVVYTRGVWRIKGIIQVSRSIAEPSILIRKLKPQDLFLIFASDGLWEQLSDETAVDIVFRNPRAGIAKRLVRAALQEVAKKEREMIRRYKEDRKGDKTPLP